MLTVTGLGTLHRACCVVASCNRCFKTTFDPTVMVQVFNIPLRFNLERGLQRLLVPTLSFVASSEPIFEPN